jgi:hypothetical protein
MFVFLAVTPFLPLLVSRLWDWWEAWVSGLISILGCGVGRALAARRRQDLLAGGARALDHADARSRDNILAPRVCLNAGLPRLVAGLILYTAREGRILQAVLAG